MKKPKMILFDYGQTLINEIIFDPLAGTEAIMREVTVNPYNVSAKEVQSLAVDLNYEIRNTLIEVPFINFDKYLYDYYKLEFRKSPDELEEIFAQAAITGEMTKDIDILLEYLYLKDIRTGVISNISLSSKIVRNTIEANIPQNHFEFIVTSSEYVFRKPHSRIYKIALRKAELSPDEVWYCGDNAVCDVEGARACGIFPVWYKGALKNEHIPESECLEIYAWNELIDILDSLSN